MYELMKAKGAKNSKTPAPVVEPEVVDLGPPPPTPWQLATIEMEDFLFAVNAVLGSDLFRSECSHADDLRSALQVFDEEMEGRVDLARLRKALTTLGEPLTKADAKVLLAFVDEDETAEEEDEYEEEEEEEEEEEVEFEKMFEIELLVQKLADNR